MKLKVMAWVNRASIKYSTVNEQLELNLACRVLYLGCSNIVKGDLIAAALVVLLSFLQLQTKLT